MNAYNDNFYKNELSTGQKNESERVVCTKDLFSWAFQIARGMEFVSQKKVRPRANVLTLSVI